MLFFNYDFPISLTVQLNIEFPLELTANFPLLRQLWIVKMCVIKGKCVTKGVSTVILMSRRGYFEFR